MGCWHATPSAGILRGEGTRRSCKQDPCNHYAAAARLPALPTHARCRGLEAPLATEGAGDALEAAARQQAQQAQLAARVLRRAALGLGSGSRGSTPELAAELQEEAEAEEAAARAAAEAAGSEGAEGADNGRLCALCGGKAHKVGLKACPIVRMALAVPKPPEGGWVVSVVQGLGLQLLPARQPGMARAPQAACGRQHLMLPQAPLVRPRPRPAECPGCADQEQPGCKLCLASAQSAYKVGGSAGHRVACGTVPPQLAHAAVLRRPAHPLPCPSSAAQRCSSHALRRLILPF